MRPPVAAIAEEVALVVAAEYATGVAASIRPLQSTTTVENDVVTDTRKTRLLFARETDWGFWGRARHTLAMRRRSNPAWPHPIALSARARRIQRLTRGKSARGTYSRAYRSRPAT